MWKHETLKEECEFGSFTGDCEYQSNLDFDKYTWHETENLFKKGWTIYWCKNE